MKFTGICKSCWSAQPKARTFRTRRNPSGRGVSWHGYVTIGKNGVTDTELDMFDAMRNGSGNVLEHRWVMAKHLGRALSTRECVDHMDGNKTNNALDNLRIYVRGKNDPGSAPGYGTYYHEWQMSLAKIRELEHRLSSPCT